MKLSTLFLLLAALGCAAFTGLFLYKATEGRREWREILKHEGRPLFDSQDRGHPVLPLIRKRLMRERVSFEPDIARHWRVHRMKTRGGLSRVLVVDKHLGPLAVPSEYPMRVHVFTEDGDHLSSTKVFSAGWRVVVQSASILWTAECEADVLAISATAFKAPDIAREIYGLVHDRVALLRIEHRAGGSVMNSFYAPNLTIGPEVPLRTEEEWEAALHSEDPGEVLMTLSWLGGLHLDPSVRRSGNAVLQDPEKARSVFAVRARPGVKSRVAELESSSDSWIAEAARLARAEMDRKQR